MAYKTAASKRLAPAETETETQSVFELDKKKQVTVRKFNGVSLVDIREFYIDKDTQEKKPGKKGISLTEDVWRKLLEQKDEIDAALAELNGKKRKIASEKESELPKEAESADAEENPSEPKKEDA
ncbi:Transcriptional Coactivator p15 PC4 [Metschnikowia aff. pulcherrima]|uniref:Transcriptional Coactivator p15 PC4 n=1 Tax=Metschnikowia aff. pulcherrima TaxID=2163413 RepID=A0A4P6XNC3_9ASCO|nr:Transcriptional Coactivator p15 PC4 [Metschnikowia aff. pulcherrima]